MKSWRFTMTKNCIPGREWCLIFEHFGLLSLGVVVRSVLTGLKSINLEHMKMPANWHIARFRLRGKTLGWVVFRVQGAGWFSCAFLRSNEGPTKGFVGCCWLGCVVAKPNRSLISSCWCIFFTKISTNQIDSKDSKCFKRDVLFSKRRVLVGTFQISLGFLAATSRSQPTARQRFMSSFWDAIPPSNLQPPTARISYNFVTSASWEGGASQCISHRSRPKWCWNDTAGM